MPLFVPLPPGHFSPTYFTVFFHRANLEVFVEPRDYCTCTLQAISTVYSSDKNLLHGFWCHAVLRPPHAWP